MDANRFDAFVKALGHSAARRGMIAGLFSGGLATLLPPLESDARRRANRAQKDDDLAVEKRKKRKKKKRKKRKKGSSGDEAPLCTENSCPLPPGCSQQALEACQTAFQEELLADAEPCRAVCEGGDSPACRECLRPIVLAHRSGAEACVVESCLSSDRSATRGNSRAAARAWWERKCDKPCCFADLTECQEDARDEWLAEMTAAALACFGPPPAGLLVCLPAMLGVQARLLYNDQKCQYRYGCQQDGPYWGSCGPGDHCCPHGRSACGEDCCDLSHETCCFNAWCCNVAGAACCTMTTGDQYCCDTGLACKPSGGPTCQSGGGSG